MLDLVENSPPMESNEVTLKTSAADARKGFFSTWSPDQLSTTSLFLEIRGLLKKIPRGNASFFQAKKIFYLITCANYKISILNCSELYWELFKHIWSYKK